MYDIAVGVVCSGRTKVQRVSLGSTPVGQKRGKEEKGTFVSYRSDTEKLEVIFLDLKLTEAIVVNDVMKFSREAAKFKI